MFSLACFFIITAFGRILNILALQNIFKLTLCAAITKDNLVHMVKSRKNCCQQAI